MAKGKFGKDKSNHDAGLFLGKRGARRMHAVKVAMDTKATIVRKKDRGYAKKAKRRALRTIAVPAELENGRKRTNKKVLVASMLMQEQMKREGLEEEEEGEDEEEEEEDDMGDA
jgi:hypothetical protein